MTIRICYYIIYFLEGIIFLQYCSMVFISKHSKLVNVCALFFLYGIISSLSGLGRPLLNIVSFFGCNLIYILLFYHANFYESLFHSAIATSVMTICETIVIYLSPYELTFSFSNWEDFHVWIIPVVLEKMLYFLVMLVFAHFSKRSKHQRENLNSSSMLIVIVPVVSLFILYTFLCIRAKAILTSPLQLLITISSISLLILNIMIWEIYSYIQKKNSEITGLKLIAQREDDMLIYYKMLNQQNESQRQLIHDIKKHLQSILFFNQKGDCEKISSYINSIINSSYLKASARICNNELLNAILSRYMQTCQENDISFRVDIRNKSLDFLKEEDMTSLFCNLLDNAIEATQMIPNAQIELTSYHQENTSFTVITLQNSCRVNPFNAESNELVSTKSDKFLHGYGLKIIERVVKEYGGETQYYYSEDDYSFHSIVTLMSQQ